MNSDSDNVSVLLNECPMLLGDLDLDGDVDLYDFAIFLDCFTGPGGGPPPPECLLADINRDSDVDRADFALFQTAFTGEAS